MAIRVNRSVGRDSSGRIRYSGTTTVGRSRRSSGGGFEVAEGGEVSNERGALIENRVNTDNAAAAAARDAMQLEAAATRQESTAIASTVGPGGAPGVIRQTTSTGGFSAPFQGGAGIGTQSYSSQDFVQTGAPTQRAPNSPIRGTIQPATAPPGRVRTFVGAFGRGASQDVWVNSLGGRTGSSGNELYGANTAASGAFELGRGARAVAEPIATVFGTNLAIRGAGAATAAARASRFGQLPVARTVLGPGATGFFARGVAGVGAIGVGTRAFEQRGINRIGRDTGITDLGPAIREAEQNYASGTGFGRGVAESVSFGFSDRNRFENEVENSIVARGVSRAQARETAAQVYNQRFNTRARSDVAVGIVGEFTGEGVGRRVTTNAARFITARMPRLSNRALTVGSATIGSFSGGVVEGSIQAGASDIQSTGRVSARNVARGAAFGGVFAGSAGGGLSFLRSAGTRRGSRAANIVEGGLDVLDPLERPGDVTADIFENSYRASAARRGFPRVVAPSFGNNNAGNRGFNIGSVARSSARSAAPSFSLTPFTASTPTRGNTPSIANTPSFSLVPTRTRSVAPFSFANTRISNRVTTPVNVPTNVPARVNTRVNTSEFPFLPLPAFGGGGGRGGKGKGNRGNRSDIYASSLTAGLFNIRAPRGQKRSGGFGGFEIRGL